MVRWQYTVTEALRATENILTETLGGLVDGVYRIVTPADDALMGELDGKLADGTAGAIVLLMVGGLAEENRELVRGNLSTYPVTVMIALRRDSGPDIGGGLLDAQRFLAERIDELEEKIDETLNVVDGNYLARDFKITTIRKVGGLALQATEALPDVLLHPIEYEYHRRRDG